MPHQETIGDLGETRVLKLIGRLIGAPGQGEVGFGDDAAVIPRSRGATFITTDVMVQDIHFKTHWFRPEEVGFKTLAVNLSDAAAMGGHPTHAVVSLILPRQTRIEAVRRFYRGLLRLARREGVAVVGGNLSAGKEISATVTLTGTFPRGDPILRSGARPGDCVYVTGQPGLARLGFLLLSRKGKAKKTSPDLWAWFQREPAWRKKLRGSLPGASKALQRFLAPEPRLPMVRALSLYRPTALVDVSDGLASDLRHLGGSGFGVLIEEAQLPGTPGFRKLAVALGEAPVETSLSGGEDYELLIAVPEEAAERLGPRAVLAGTPFTRIGRVVSGKGILVQTKKGRVPIPARGFEHFRSRANRRRQR